MGCKMRWTGQNPKGPKMKPNLLIQFGHHVTINLHGDNATVDLYMAFFSLRHMIQQHVYVQKLVGQLC